MGGDQRLCEAGAIIFVPAGVRHGFMAESDAVLDAFSEQRMGVYVVVVASDGSESEEEVFMENFLASHHPPVGQAYTPRERIRAVYATTRHLLGPLPASPAPS